MGIPQGRLPTSFRRHLSNQSYYNNKQKAQHKVQHKKTNVRSHAVVLQHGENDMKHEKMETTQ